jgi:lysophospholipase L1-like esterase
MQIQYYNNLLWKINLLFLLVLLGYIGFQSHTISGQFYEWFPSWFVEEDTKGTGFLALGDSYVKGEGVKRNESWPGQLEQISNLSLQGVIARTGWTSDHLLQYGMPVYETVEPEIVMIQIGANDVVRGVNEEHFRHTISRLLAKVNETEQVVVLSIPQFSLSPYVLESEISSSVLAVKIQRFNRILKEETMAVNAEYISINKE